MLNSSCKRIEVFMNVVLTRDLLWVQKNNNKRK